jgi:hypothetical protein
VNDTTKAEEAAEWRPPFCANLVENVECPVCESEDVHVREHETYFDGSDYEAFCGDCHAELTIWASVNVAFSAPEALEKESEEG